jgi:hypothetical protein
MSKAVTQTQINRLLGWFGLVLTLILLAGSGLALWGRSFATSQVQSQLTQEKVYFPDRGTPALDPKEFPALQQYAGQEVDSGAKAKAYADQFIWVHMMKASGGQTYAQVSNAAMAKPTNTALAGLKATLFQGDMLRSSLLTAYAFSVFGIVAGYAVLGCLAAAGVTLVFSVVCFARRS